MISVRNLALGLALALSGLAAQGQGLIFGGAGSGPFGTACGAGNALQQYLCGSMAVGEWKLMTKPGSGGVATNAVTASISGTTMTVSSVATASIGIGQYAIGSGVTTNTKIIGFGTGTGGSGTYTVSPSQSSTVTSITVWVPRTRANFDGGSTWATDSQVDANVSSSSLGGVGSGASIGGFSGPSINPFNGDVLFRGGGGTSGGDGSILGMNLYNGPGMTWKVLVPGARIIPASETPQAYYQPTQQPTSLRTTTASGANGSNSLVVADATGMVASTDAFIFAAAGGIQQGTSISAISGTTLTLSKTLTSILSSTPVRYVRNAYFPVANVNGVPMPAASGTTTSSTFVPNSDAWLLGCGLTMFGSDSGQHDCGAGYVFKPSLLGTNDGMQGPFQLAAGTLTQALARHSFNLNGASNTAGCVAGNDFDGKVYTFSSDASGEIGRASCRERVCLAV